ncbi:MAG: division/cell wall cluster transcriptional repressor MraZ [Pseudomonadota bacterium]
MGRRFRGESNHKVDAKGRVSIPAPFRRVLEEGDPDWSPGANPNLVLVYGRKGRKCLEGYSMRSMEEVDDMVSALPRYSREREILERMLNTQSVYAQVDENGRMVLSPRLREMIGVAGEATFAGMGDKFQIWEPSAYSADMAAIDDWLGEQPSENDPFALLDALPRSG